MADCECLATCLFFNDKMPESSGLGAIYKHKYCQGDNTHCARHKVKATLGKTRVPTNLYPNMWAVADELIAKG